MSAKPEDKLSYIMTKKVVTVHPDQKVSEALDLMVKHNIGSLIVTEKNSPIGMVTERDIVQGIVKNRNIFSSKVGEIMAQPLITATPETPTWEAFRVMLTNRIRRLPVLDNGRLVGMVTERDLFRWVLLVAYEPNLPSDIKEIVEKGYSRQE